MEEPLELRSGDRVVQQLKFKPYRNVVERQALKFQPKDDEPQAIQVRTPWGEQLLCKKGDYIVNETDTPDDRWPVDESIFESSYESIRPGIYVKKALTYLFPLESVTRDKNLDVKVFTLEGPVTVRAGDFFLARGIRGEIWPYPKNKVDSTLREVESN
jgi:hypothetical protein